MKNKMIIFCFIATSYVGYCFADSTLTITTIPYDANITVFYDRKNKCSYTAPVELDIKNLPKAISFSRQGFHPTLIEEKEIKGNKKLNVKLNPITEEAMELLKYNKDSIDNMIKFLELFPMLIDTQFYNIHKRLIINNVKKTSIHFKISESAYLLYTNPVNGNLVYLDYKDNSYKKSRYIFNPLEPSTFANKKNEYTLYFFNKQKYLIEFYKRHFKNLISLTTSLNKNMLVVKETYSTSFLWSKCDCYYVHILLEYSLNIINDSFKYDTITYYLMDKYTKKQKYPVSIKIGKNN